MNPSKAIELNRESEQSLRKHKFIDHADAIKLGIEALKAMADIQETRCPLAAYHKFGETPKIDTKRSLHTIKKILESPLGGK